MENKHTPGPWRACGADRGGCPCGQVWSIPSDFMVATATLCDEELGEIPTEQMMANARLVAAAPEMLEVLQKFCTTYEETRVINYSFYEEFKAAIEKATNQ